MRVSRSSVAACRILSTLLCLLWALPGSQAQVQSPTFIEVSPPTVAKSKRLGFNLFSALLGQDEAALDARLEQARKLYFEGNRETERLYFEDQPGEAYILDVGNGDVRSEGMSYGLMLCVQLKRRHEFDALWAWANRHMRHQTGPRAGLFAWQCDRTGKVLDPTSACDGEEWMVTALFCAAACWQEPRYAREARSLLQVLRHGPANPGEIKPFFDPATKLIVFVPIGEGATFTDPSYHVPAFYAYWAACVPEEAPFWREVALQSRRLLQAAAHPRTGLMPDYCEFDGRPKDAFGGGHQDFRFDAWRTLAHVALDQYEAPPSAWAREQSNRALRFLLNQGPRLPNQFQVDGKPLSNDHSLGLSAMAAVAGQAADPQLATPFLRELWDAEPPTGHWRYYDGLLYSLALLEAGGRFELPTP